MKVSERLCKWAIRFYPPLLLQRIWAVKIDKGYRGVTVNIYKSLLNKNYNGSIFGGTIFAAADPFYLMLFHQIFAHKGYRVIAWSKSSQIQFLKPGFTKLQFRIHISESDIAEAERMLITEGRYITSFNIDIYNTDGEVCANLVNEVYLRNQDMITP